MSVQDEITGATAVCEGFSNIEVSDKNAELLIIGSKALQIAQQKSA